MSQELCWQEPSLAVYGQLDSLQAPFDFKKLKPLSINPPWQPASTLSQSTSCCSLKLGRALPAIFHAPSVEPVVEKAQQLPHWPWFFTGVTAPLVVQSTEAAVTSVSTCWPRLGREP